ncbi:TPA: hypothetical protein SG772_001728 [Campylobacter coli]|nr:hypothetical protein [Campylobacter coli]
MKKTIQEYFQIYSEINTTKNIIKKFSILDRRLSIVNYIKKNKLKLIKSINFSFFESDEKYILSSFSNENINFIHINSRLTKDYPGYFENKKEYENYLAIYGTIGILLNQNFQITTIKDTTQKYADFYKDITNAIFYDEDFNLNLSEYTLESELHMKYTYLFGIDFVIYILNSFYQNNITKQELFDVLNINDTDFNFLFEKFKFKIKEINYGK